jgi:aminoglycoside phosphotransferase (APT) family kinase protein
MPLTDMELTRLIGAPAASRRPWPYRSSLPIEVVEVPGNDPERVLLKDLSASASVARAAFTADPLREVVAYREVLPQLELDTPRHVASLAEPERVVLVIELVDGYPLWQADGLAAWEQAARWLARLHAAQPIAAARLVRYDATELRRRTEMAAWLPGIEDLAARVAERLGRLPAGLVHGEFYPANVLVQDSPSGPRIRPVDWETMGIGPGVLDLAALTAGWEDEHRNRIVDAYRSACSVDRRPDDADISLGRLVLAAQWSGSRGRWSPPSEQRHDWHAEVLRLAGSISE